jgi:serine/threonine protein kinase
MAEDPASKVSRRAVRIGKYEVLAHIATGGMGAVYKARDTENDREVALKVLMPDTAAKANYLERFRREARSVAKLCHENIVALYEFGESRGAYFLALEFVDGTDLHDYVSRLGPLDPDEALSVVLQGCRALQHAHDNAIIHRDIKPSNFLVTVRDGHLTVKLTDLGLAREVETDEFRLTRMGATVGTIDYIAPEQARDSGLADGRSDLYSLGATWFFLLTGRPPFPKGGLGERVLRLLTEEAPDVRALNKDVPADTAAVIRRLLAKDPDARYQTPTELLHELHGLQQGHRPAAPAEPPREADYLTAPPVQRLAGAPTPQPPAATTADEIGFTKLPRPPGASRPAPKRLRRRRKQARYGLIISLTAVAVVAALVLAVTLFLIFRNRRADVATEPADAFKPPPVAYSKPPSVIETSDTVRHRDVGPSARPQTEPAAEGRSSAAGRAARRSGEGRLANAVHSKPPPRPRRVPQGTGGTLGGSGATPRRAGGADRRPGRGGRLPVAVGRLCGGPGRPAADPRSRRRRAAVRCTHCPGRPRRDGTCRQGAPAAAAVGCAAHPGGAPPRRGRREGASDLPGCVRRPPCPGGPRHRRALAGRRARICGVGGRA